MPYALPTDLLAAWPRLHTTGMAHDEIRTMIARAGNLVDAALASRYTVPFATDPSSAPPLIRDLVVDLAWLDMIDRMPNPPEWISRRIERAQQKLELLADGDLQIIGADGVLIAEITTQGTIRSNTSGYTPVFGAVPSLRETFPTSRVADENAARGVSSTEEDWP